MADNVNTSIYDKNVHRAAMVRLYEQRIHGKVSSILDSHFIRLEKLLEGTDFSQKEISAIRERIDRELTKTYSEAHLTTNKSLVDFAIDQISYTYQTLNTEIGKIWNVERPQRRIAEEIVLKKPLYNNVTLLSGWAGVSYTERKKIDLLIRKGMAEGWPASRISKEVRKGNIFAISKNQADALVTTAITSVHAQVDHEVYQANEKALEGWQYISVLDSRTTPICVHRDGAVYPISDTEHLPPAHFRCRSRTTPVVKQWNDLASMEGVAQIRKRNLKGLTQKQIQYYDGALPLKESYSDWLKRQPEDVQLKHLGDSSKVDLFNSGKLTLDRFTTPEGKSVGIKELRALSNPTVVNDTRRFADARIKLDSLKLGASHPDDFLDDPELISNLKEYYLLQAGDLDGNLSLINYRGKLLHNKKATKIRVLNSPPTEDNLIFNPITGRYEDNRLYQPSLDVLSNAEKLVDESEGLLDRDKVFIKKFVADLSDKMGVNERAVVSDNLRITFSRARKDTRPWQNFKAVANSQLNFDIMNISDNIETRLRKDSDILKKLSQDSFIDPVLGPIQLQELHDKFFENIIAKNKWEDKTAAKIGRELRGFVDTKIPIKIRSRVSDKDMSAFYTRFAHRLSLADMPDRDQLAVSLGRDLYNMANFRGSRNEWWKLGVKLLDDADNKGIFSIETFGVQKRRMRSRLSGQYFGPYYDTFSVNLRIIDPRIQEYSQLTRKVDVGMRVSVVKPENRLLIREGFKTYFIDRGIFGMYDTRIPLTSTSSFSDFPDELIDANMTRALNWAGKAQYKIDEDFFNFTKKLLYFTDDKGKSKYYDDLNHYRKYITSRGDSYERFKAMEWLHQNNYSFSNNPFLDHRARIYERGFIGPQSGETFRPFLNTAELKSFSPEGFFNFQDQVGSFLGGISDHYEGRFNSLSFTGRQKIAEKWRHDLVTIGNHMLRSKPADIRAILESDFVQNVDGEELGKFFRFAIEAAKIDSHLTGSYTKKSLETLRNYKTALALEQDASSSGAQIIALTTRNKQLAELSNVIPTSYKKRLYDEIANLTYNDPRFKTLNEKLGLSEKDLRKAAKAQNMVTFYGAGERTGIMNVEGKLAKALNREGTLVVRASERDKVLNEISARMARVERYDADLFDQLKALRQDVKDVFNKGLDPGDEILEQLWFLEPGTKELVEKLSASYLKTVTPDDFKQIATIMSEYLREQVPILKDFTRYFGRLAEDYLTNAKPGDYSRGFEEFLLEKTVGVRSTSPPSFLERLPWYKPNSPLSNLLFGVRQKKIPKKWTSVPWVNFDGKTIEQTFTQRFEERLNYQDKDGKWITNILQIDQKTDPTWWDEILNKDDTINDIADVSKARTAFPVNGNHSNDATLVKRFHLWGEANNIATSTVHDAFFTNIVDMLPARKALRGIYAESLNENVIKNTLDEMLKRGFPKELYKKYLEEAIDIGLIPVIGRSKVGGKILTVNDIITKQDILKEIKTSFESDFGFYGVG